MIRLLCCLPNAISILRIFLSLYSIYLICSAIVGVGVTLFIVAAVSDFIDGYLARKYNWITEFGKLIDPISDKVLVLAGFVLLAINELLPWWLVILMGIREIGLTVYRIVVIQQGRAVIPAGWWGKCKTTVQMITIAMGLMFMIANYRFQIGDYGFPIFRFLILTMGCSSLILSLYSGYLILKGRNGTD